MTRKPYQVQIRYDAPKVPTGWLKAKAFASEKEAIELKIDMERTASVREWVRVVYLGPSLFEHSA